MKKTTGDSVLKHWAVAMLCLAVVLGFLFRESFQTEKVLFANDAPLGLISSNAGVQASTFEGIISGFWQDLNWIGVEMPSVLPGFSWAIFQFLGANPVTTAKFSVPVAFCFLGFTAWLLFRTLGFAPVVCVIGGLAAALNTNPFSHGTWGLPSRALAWAAALLAIAALYSGTRSRPWMKAALAGMCVGLAIIEAFDVGALYSLYIAAFGIFLAFQRTGATERVKGITRVAVVAIAAALFAAQALSVLIGTQVKGVVGMEQDAATKQKRWDEATVWSLPKAETLRVIIPGLFGYRMDTPEGGAYWGNVGHSDAMLRHSGAGEYAGIIVVLIGVIGAANAFRKKDPVYSDLDRRLVKFWIWAAVISILFAWGRYAPFYQFLYKLPFFSTIRNPIKFMHFFHLALLILFGYGLQVVLTRFVGAASGKIAGPMEQFQNWWARAAAFDRRVVLGLGAGLGISLLGFLMYSGSKDKVARYLEGAGFPGAAGAEVAAFSLGEVGLYLVFYVAALVVILLCVSGFFSGTRARWAAVAIGLVLVIDMARANKPWIIHYNYKDRYVDNSVFQFLRKDGIEGRVSSRIVPFRGGALLSQQMNFMQGVFSEWLQNQFQYFNIQSLDIIQMPRVPELDDRYNKEFIPTGESLQRVTRLWELSNTRYLLGQREYLPELNRAFDPQLQRFRIATNFDFAPKAGRSATANLGMDDLTWETKPDGRLAIFEFTGALPRYRLYTQWQKVEDAAALGILTSPVFNPQERVLLHDDVSIQAGSATNAGTVSLVSYAPKRIEVKTETSGPAILLWNDRWSPNWKAFVDGAEVKLLRANYIMRAIEVPAGAHKVEMRYAQPAQMLWVSFATLAVGVLICSFFAWPVEHSKVENTSEGILRTSTE